MGELDSPISILQFNDLHRSGGMLLFFDGYDEVKSDLKERVTQEINDFSSRYRNSRIVITSRDDSSLPSFGCYKAFNIRSLEYQEACLLLNKYGEMSKKTIHQAIISHIERMNDNGLRSLLSNPLMVSLLFKAYDYKNKIPPSKSAFYEQVYDALFEGHDLSKDGFERERRTALDKYSFEDILKSIAYKSVRNAPNYDRLTLTELILMEIKSKVHLNFTVDDFIKDVLWAIPLMLEDGLEFRWTHKSFQEYFSALYIVSCPPERKNLIISSMFSGTRSVDYQNIIEMCLSLDRSTVLKVAILPYIESYYKYYNNMKTTVPWIQGNDMIYRVSLAYGAGYNFSSVRMGRNDEKKDEASTILKAVSRTNDSIGYILFHSDKHDVITCRYICDRRQWIAETLERNGVFKGIERVTISADENLLNGDDIEEDKFDIYIPSQSSEDYRVDSKYYRSFNTMMLIVSTNLFGGKPIFIDPEKCPEIISAIRMSIESVEYHDDDFS